MQARWFELLAAGYKGDGHGASGSLHLAECPGSLAIMSVAGRTLLSSLSRGGERSLRSRGKHPTASPSGLFPAIVFDHVSQLYDVLALLVLLARLKGMLIFPAQSGLAALTEDVSHCMKACQ